MAMLFQRLKLETVADHQARRERLEAAIAMEQEDSPSAPETEVEADDLIPESATSTPDHPQTPMKLSQL